MVSDSDAPSYIAISLGTGGSGGWSGRGHQLTTLTRPGSTGSKPSSRASTSAGVRVCHGMPAARMLAVSFRPRSGSSQMICVKAM